MQLGYNRVGYSKHSQQFFVTKFECTVKHGNNDPVYNNIMAKTKKNREQFWFGSDKLQQNPLQL